MTKPRGNHGRNTGTVWLCTLFMLFTLTATAQTLPETVTLSSYAYCQYPSVAASNGGATILAVWIERHSGYKYIYYKVCTNGDWGAKQLFSGPAYPEYPHLVADSQNNFHMVWMEGSGGGRDIGYAKFSNGSWNNWTGADADFVEVTPSQRDVWPRLAIDPDNDTLHAVWSKHKTTAVNYDAEIFHAQKTPVGGWVVERVSFDSYRRLNYHSDITARNGQVAAIWEQHNIGVFSSQRNSNGTWTTPVQIRSGSAKWPSIANDGNGNVHGLYGYGNLIYTRRTASGSWSDVGAINTYSRYKNHVDIRTDYFDNVYAVFQQGPEGPTEGVLTYLAGRLMIRRGDTDGHMDNAEVLWTRDQGFVHSPVVAPDNNGSVHVVWFDAGVGFPEEKWLDWGPVYYVKTAAGPGAAIKVLTPNGGEVYESGAEATITWIASDSIANVRIEVSDDNGQNWYEAVESTENDGEFQVTVPDFASTECLVRVSDASDGDPMDTSDRVFSVYLAGTIPVLDVDRDSLNFGSEAGQTTQSQDVVISNAGGGTLEWTTSTDSNWLSCTPASGSETGVVTISVSPTGLAAGTYNGAVTIDAGNAANSPRNINVSLRVYGSGTSNAPFGAFSTPINDSTVRNSISVSGWVLDDVEVVSVKIYREVGSDLVYIGDATFVEGARPDVETAYPNHPLNYRAGWGYMLLTYGLPNQGLADDFILRAIARDKDGHSKDLGSKLIHCDNQNANQPFGSIATPLQGGEASGTNFENFGWALTPTPNMIPSDGSTISVIVDGVAIGNPEYGIYREDIARIFPGYMNSEGASGRFILDTTAFSNGVHTIAWLVVDDNGNQDGIGSRFFSILNTGGSTSSSTQATATPAMKRDNHFPTSSMRDLTDDMSPLVMHRNINLNGGKTVFNRPGDDVFMVPMVETGLIRLELTPDALPVQFTGYMQVNDQLRPLPIGSTLDGKHGIFYWQPGPGFLGDYDLVFVDLQRRLRKRVRITVLPKTFVTGKTARD